MKIFLILSVSIIICSGDSPVIRRHRGHDNNYEPKNVLHDNVSLDDIELLLEKLSNELLNNNNNMKYQNKKDKGKLVEIENDNDNNNKHYKHKSNWDTFYLSENEKNNPINWHDSDISEPNSNQYNLNNYETDKINNKKYQDKNEYLKKKSKPKTYHKKTSKVPKYETQKYYNNQYQVENYFDKLDKFVKLLNLKYIQNKSVESKIKKNDRIENTALVAPVIVVDGFNGINLQQNISLITTTTESNVLQDDVQGTSENVVEVVDFDQEIQLN